MRVKIGVNGDRRITEKVILEIKAVARRLGLEIANVEVVSKSLSGRKAPKPKPVSRRKSRART